MNSSGVRRDLCANAKLRDNMTTNFQLSPSKRNGVLVLYSGDWGRLRTLTVKSCTELAEEAAAAMLNNANPPAIGRSTSGETAAERGKRGQGGGRAKGLARRAWRPQRSGAAEEGRVVTAAAQRRERSGAGRGGIGEGSGP